MGASKGPIFFNGCCSEVSEQLYVITIFILPYLSNQRREKGRIGGFSEFMVKQGKKKIKVSAFTFITKKNMQPRRARSFTELQAPFFKIKIYPEIWRL
jgi:hypothetical protein